ncbi:MAG: hypothetical protein WAQ25_02830 [Candidatus Saccharimonas sp.]
MNTIAIKKRTVTAFIATLALCAITVTLPAAHSYAQESAEPEEAKERERDQDREKPKQTPRASAKLEGEKLTACQKREKNIANITTRIADRGKKQVALFSGIAERVQTFYVTKGKTVEHYDALVADMNAKKAAAEQAVEVITASSGNFTCTAGDPKSNVDSFKQSLTTQIEAIKAYKTSVKNLIVAVKSVQSSEVKQSETR